MTTEQIFTMDTSSIKYGPGSTREVGQDIARLGAKRVLVVTDPMLAESAPVQTVRESLKAAKIEAVIFSGTRIEPTDESFKTVIEFAAGGNFDGYVGVGGGSSIDTAKIANLYATYPNDFLAYVNAPIGRGEDVPGPVKPLIAIPTTAGTGSETTGVAVFDLLERHVKTGISHRALRPVMGIIDPDNTRTLPPMVAACTGLDVLSHALESLTAVPYHQRPAAESPGKRPPYQGSNPISDIWSSKAVEMVSRSLLPAMTEPDNDHARGEMLLAASFAGIGFGNAGVHLPHGMSYPVSGMVRDFTPDGYDVDWPLVPHGMSVILNAPAVFRFTAPADPARHLYGASLMGVDIVDVDESDAGDVLAGALIDLMQKTGMPNGLGAIGFSEADLDRLVEGALAQQRLNKLSPRPFDEAGLKDMFRDALRYW